MAVMEMPSVGEQIDVVSSEGNELMGRVIKPLADGGILFDVFLWQFDAWVRMVGHHDGSNWKVALTEGQVAAANEALTL